MKSLISQKSL